MKNINKTVVQFIAWLGSSMVGLSAILYGLGFLVVHSHLNLLGVTNSSVPPIEYLKEGGRFIVMNLILIYSDITFLILFLSIIPIFILIKLFSINVVSNDYITGDKINFIINGIKKVFLKFYSWIIIVIMIILIGMVLHQLPLSFISISVNNLLLTNELSTVDVSKTVTTTNETSTLPFSFLIDKVNSIETISTEIQSSESAARISRYQNLLLLFTVLLILLWFLSMISIRDLKIKSSIENNYIKLFNKILLIIVTAITFFEFVLLPMNFGKLIVPNEYPVVLITTLNKGLIELIPADKFYFLLVKNDKEIILYDRNNPTWESIIILKRDQVSSIRVIGQDSVF